MPRSKVIKGNKIEQIFMNDILSQKSGPISTGKVKGDRKVDRARYEYEPSCRKLGKILGGSPKVVTQSEGRN